MGSEEKAEDALEAQLKRAVGPVPETAREKAKELFRESDQRGDAVSREDDDNSDDSAADGDGVESSS